MAPSFAKEVEMIQSVNKALEDVDKWCNEHKLTLAPEKTEALIISGRRRTKATFLLREQQIIPGKKVFRGCNG